MQICKAFEVSESGYYKWLKGLKKDIAEKDADLLAKIKAIKTRYAENENYGVQRVFLALQTEYDYKGSLSTVYRVMKKNNLLCKIKRHPNGITKADSEAQKSENLIKQDFSAEKANEKWLTDISEVECSDGKLYVAPVLDCHNGEIVGLAMDDNMRKELCITAFENACKSTNAKGMILHSDRGSQFTSYDFRNKLAQYEAVQSMSGTGRCYDNARMESFFATLKKEKLYKINTKKLPRRVVQTIIFRYIMVYYNRQRICTTNKLGLPPAIYRERCMNDFLVAA